MALSEVDLAKIKVDYEAGKMSKRKVAQKFGISRNTLDKHAKEKEWFYAKNERKLSQKIERLTLDRLVVDEVDRAAKITDEYLSNVDKYNQLAMVPAKEMAEAYIDAEEGNVKVTKEEFSRLWESAKVIKTALEGLKIVYEGQRKALGMDREKEESKETGTSIIFNIE